MLARGLGAHCRRRSSHSLSVRPPEILGRLSDFSNSVSVYAGAPGGTVNGIMYSTGMSEVTLTGYNVHGAVVASDTATVGAEVTPFAVEVIR